MSYTNSSLVSYTKISPNKTINRNHSIDRITPHCVVGQCSVETLGNIFAPTSRQASSNYGIGKDGRIGMYCEEKDRSWCSSSGANDHRAITIEVASDTTHPYAVNEKAYASLIKLCVDICKRYGKKKLLWLGNKETALAYTPKSDEMVLTCHRWFANTACPGQWILDHEADLAAKVTAELNPQPKTEPSTKVLYRVQTGAFSIKKNADNLAATLKAKGYDTYIVQANGLYKVQVGAYGVKRNAENMLAKLKSAGYQAFITTQSGTAVNTSLPTLKSIDEIAREVINGKWGNGVDRKNRLTAAGYDYAKVQTRVNELCR